MANQVTQRFRLACCGCGNDRLVGIGGTRSEIRKEIECQERSGLCLSCERANAPISHRSKATQFTALAMSCSAGTIVVEADLKRKTIPKRFFNKPKANVGEAVWYPELQQTREKRA